MPQFPPCVTYYNGTSTRFNRKLRPGHHAFNNRRGRALSPQVFCLRRPASEAETHLTEAPTPIDAEFVTIHFLLLHWHRFSCTTLEAMDLNLRKPFSRIKAPLNAALVVLLLLLQTLATSPLLHSDVHDDASSEHHTCAVTILSQGQLDLSDSSTTFPLPPVQIITEQQDFAPNLTLLFFSASSSRGPPSLA